MNKKYSALEVIAISLAFAIVLIDIILLIMGEKISPISSLLGWTIVIINSFGRN